MEKGLCSVVLVMRGCIVEEKRIAVSTPLTSEHNNSKPNRTHHWHIMEWFGIYIPNVFFVVRWNISEFGKSDKLNQYKINLHQSNLFFWVCFFCYITCICQKSDAEKVTVKGSHGDSSLQRESDSFRVKRTVSQQGTAVRSAPRGPTQNQTDQTLIVHTRTYTATKKKNRHHLVYRQVRRCGLERERGADEHNSRWPIAATHTMTVRRSKP